MPGRGTRRRLLGTVGVGAVALAAMTAPGQAAPAVPGAAAPRAAAVSKAPKATQLGAGRYVVLLRAPSAATYAGGRAGLPATRATGGQQFRADTPRGPPVLRVPAQEPGRHRLRARHRHQGPLHHRQQRLRGEPHGRAGPAALLGPPRPGGPEGHPAPRRHLEHPDLPRPRREERRLEGPRRHQQGRGGRRDRRPRLGRLGGVEVVPRQEAQHPARDAAGTRP